MNIQLAEIKEIFEVTSKLEQAFRHIKDLCGKYLEYQSGSFPPSYGMPLGPEDHYYPPHSSYYVPSNQPYIPGYNNYMESQDPMKSNSQSKKFPTQQQKTGYMVNGNINGLRPENQKRIQPSKAPMNQNTNTNMNKPSQKPSSKSNIPLPPSSACALFLSAKRQHIRKQYPQLNNEQLNEIMQQVWNSFNSTQKQPYEQQYQRLKKLYQSKIKEMKKMGETGESEKSLVQSVKNQVKKNG